MKDLFNNIKVVKSIAPISGAGSDAAIVGEVVDHRGFRSACYVIETGVLADANATFTTLLEESDDGLSFSAVADADLEGTEALASFDYADDGKQFKLGYKGAKDYTRLTLTPANNTGAWPIAAQCILGHPDAGPQSTQET